MTKTLIYDFDGTDFEYDIDVSNWIEQYLDVQELMELAVDIYDDVMSEEEKKEAPFELVKSGDKDAIDYVLSGDNAEEVIFDRFSDIIEDTYEDDAKELYEDQKEYDKDPAGYYGFSRNDFI